MLFKILILLLNVLQRLVHMYILEWPKTQTFLREVKDAVVSLIGHDLEFVTSLVYFTERSVQRITMQSWKEYLLYIARMTNLWRNYKLHFTWQYEGIHQGSPVRNPLDPSGLDLTFVEQTQSKGCVFWQQILNTKFMWPCVWNLFSSYSFKGQEWACIILWVAEPD